MKASNKIAAAWTSLTISFLRLIYNLKIATNVPIFCGLLQKLSECSHFIQTRLWVRIFHFDEQNICFGSFIEMKQRASRNLDRFLVFKVLTFGAAKTKDGVFFFLNLLGHACLTSRHSVTSQTTALGLFRVILKIEWIILNELKRTSYFIII